MKRLIRDEKSSGLLAPPAINVAPVEAMKGLVGVGGVGGVSEAVRR